MRRTNRTKRRWAILLAMGLAVPGWSGCGGSTPAEPSLAVQYQNAVKEADPGARARKLATLAGKQFQAGDSAGGEASLAVAVQAAEELKEADAKAGALNLVADAYGRAGNTTDAKKTLRQARSTADGVEDPAVRIPLLARCAEIHAQRLDAADDALDILKEAETTAGQMTDPAARVSAQLRILSALHLAKATGDVERLASTVFEAARAVEDRRKQADSLAEAGQIAKRIGQNDVATQLFGESFAAAEQIEDANSRGYAQLNLGGRQISAGDKEAAKKSLDAAEATSEKVADRALREGLSQKIRQARNKL